MLAVNGGDVHYRYYEPHDPQKAQRTPILFIHGGPGSSHSLMYDALAALANEHPCFFYDQLGSYYSPATLTDEQMCIEHFADEINRILPQLHNKQVLLFGHSWGGAVAAYYTLNNPEKVKGLILSCPLLSTQRWIEDCNLLLSQLPHDVQETIEKCEKEGTTDSPAYQEADALFSSQHFLRTTDQTILQMKGKHKKKFTKKVYNTMWGPSEFSCSGILSEFDIFDRLHEITIPTLLLCGEHDTARPETMKMAQAEIKNATVSVIPESGHLAFLDNNFAYVAEVDLFLTKNGL